MLSSDIIDALFSFYSFPEKLASHDDLNRNKTHAAGIQILLSEDPFLLKTGYLLILSLYKPAAICPSPPNIRLFFEEGD
ncbi:MAG: hypothetical protein VB070_12035 [Clostridiaceae bacterium]|nr:hypothetical protein [Clostridiaceae bacterium]